MKITNFVDIIQLRALIDTDKTSFIFLQNGEREATKLTYKELEQQVKAIASQLQKIVNPGERALLLYPPGLDFITAFFACLYAGVIAVPAYPPRRNQHQSRLEAIIADAQPLVVMTATDLLANISNQLGQNQQFSNLQFIATNNLLSSENFTPYQATSDTLAFLQYTSGSTGTPKGVMVTHGNLLHNSKLIQTCFQNTPDIVGVSWLPPYHDMGLIGGVLQPLYVGGSMILMSPLAFIQKPWRWLQAISHYKGTTSGGPNFAYELCIKKITPEQKAQLDLSSWEVAFNGAEPIRAETLEQFTAAFKTCGFRREAFYPCYGMAEATLFVSGGLKTSPPIIYQLDDITGQNQGVPNANISVNVHKIVSCGQAGVDQKITIVDPKLLTPCSEDKVGEIWVSGPSIAKGYWQKLEETNKTFNAYLGDEGPFLRTGDLGFLYNGELYVTGRLKDLIIIRGKNYYPQDIELTVEESHQSINKPNACAVFTSEINGEESIVIVAELERGYRGSNPHFSVENLEQETPPASLKIELEAVFSSIRQAVAREHDLQVYAILLVKVGSIPKTSSGKIKRHACRDGFLAGTLKILGDSYLECTQKPAIINNSNEIANYQLKLDQADLDPTKADSDFLIQWLRSYAQERINSFIIDERRCIPPYIVLDFGNQGLLGMQVPKQYGGIALSNVSTMRILEQLGAIDSTLALFTGLNNVLGIRPILNYATNEVRDRILPILATGRELAAFALTETGAGSNPQAISAQAIPTNQGGWQLYGTKIWSGAAAWAGVINVFVQNVDHKGKPKGISGFVVRQGSKNLRQGPEALTMGMRGMIQNTIYLEGVPVKPEHLLGQPGMGMEVAQDAMMYGRLSIAAACVGGMKRCAQLMVRYAERRSISTGRLLDNPVTLKHLTDLTAATAAVESLVYRIATLLDLGYPVPVEAYTACKTSAPEFFWQAADHLVQLLGGRGYIETNIAPQILRDARILRIFEGPTETLNSFLGSRLVHQGEELARFLSEGLNAATISQRLQALAAQIYHQYNESKVDPITATRWAYLLIGELATKGILLAAAEWAYTRAESPHLHQTVTWAQLQFEQAIANTLSQFENHAIFWQANNIVERVNIYVNNIGDLEQTLAGEDRELDDFLRKNINKNLDNDPIESKALIKFEQIKQENKVLDNPDVTETQLSNNYQSIQDWIANWLAGKLKITVEKININQSFSDYGLDSVTAIELLHDLNQWLASPLELETYLIWQFPTIAQLANYIADQLEKISSPNTVQFSLLPEEAIDLNSEAILESEITPISNKSSIISQSSTIFLTGATGFLGAFLLAELFQKTSAKIYCLVRALDEDKALIRIQNNLDYYSLWQSKFSNRIIPVLGDIGRPQLGISNEYFAKLAAEIDLIYHNAAVVNWVFPYSSLKSSNVLGTQEVLRLATQSKIKPVHYISTTAVFESPSYAGKVVCEQDPLLFSEGIYLGYSQSKWVAEKLVAIARDRGLPVSIYRPPLISGHSRTGEWNIDDFTCLMIRGCVQMKAMPKLDYLMDLAPVDFVSRSIVYLSQQPESLNQVFHLNNPYPLHWSQFIEWIGEYGYPIEQIPYQDWLNRLKEESSSTNNPLSPLLSFFLKQWSDTQLTIPQMYQQKSKPRIDCQQTISALANSGITCPRLDDRLLHTYFEYLLKKGGLNPPG